MAKASKLPPAEEVTAHILKLPPEIAPAVQAIRETILAADKDVAEHIKWNNPSFWYSGPMLPSNPKEYKRDIAVLNLHKGRLMIVFPSGARLSDPNRLLEGDYKDGRRLLIFKDPEEVIEKSESLKALIVEWINTIER
jgi:hypothetical protein